eukprot:CAMPEP_0117049674 /NCGR_PEP_ID=MMETSP0472-20121206/34301_1 /TAXON_ID=693140 ORGANISM="Tiarina fusus, Strain LIS" /NCGR_SAMPLE_ID=MMETSP0472 /ASSEMBLY_ACC=CAM_ASM_000603 /LENGTH=83 /DNA_ID=CAMNT_0004763173 /DNA_START=13 /DNA_END=264 /DNA_ORIENTATION=+
MAEPMEVSQEKIVEILKATGTSNPSYIGYENLQKEYKVWQDSNPDCSVALNTALQALKRDNKVTFSIRGTASNLRHSDQIMLA